MINEIINDLKEKLWDKYKINMYNEAIMDKDAFTQALAEALCDGAVSSGANVIRCDSKIFFKCSECNLITKTFLKAINPFDKDEEVYGCPRCKSIDTLSSVCDEPYCKKFATSGWPSDAGYRNTCSEHTPKL